MNNRNKYLLSVVLLFVSTTISHAQEMLSLNVVIENLNNNQPIAGVLVFAGKDSIGVRSDSKGVFKANMIPREKIYLVKKGYYTRITIADSIRLSKKIQMKPNRESPIKLIGRDGNDLTSKITKLTLDGKMIPEAEWDHIVDSSILRDLRTSTYNNGNIHVSIKTVYDDGK